MSDAIGWASKLRSWFEADMATLERAGFLKLPKDMAKHICFDDIRWDVEARSSRKAGVCWELHRRIWLNGYMTEAHARDTFRHELAHLLSYWYEPLPGMFGYRTSHKHGPGFRRWARAMGDSGDRCHSYPEIMACRRGTWAHCPTCKQDHKKQWRYNDPTQYRCRRCRSLLAPGQVPAPDRFAAAVAKTMERPAAQVAEGAGVRDLMFQLDALKEGGLGSSKEAKALRRQLRRLDSDWRNK